MEPMRAKRVLRYYCDHCKKGSLRKNCMEKHEQRCIRNPERVCGFCLHRAEEGVQQQCMEMLITAIDNGGLEKLKAASKDCPGCIISAIVQWRAMQPRPNPLDESPEFIWIDYYNYKEEARLFWAERMDHNFDY